MFVSLNDYMFVCVCVFVNIIREATKRVLFLLYHTVNSRAAHCSVCPVLASNIIQPGAPTQKLKIDPAKTAPPPVHENMQVFVTDNNNNSSSKHQHNNNKNRPVQCVLKVSRYSRMFVWLGFWIWPAFLLVVASRGSNCLRVHRVR